jgi:hypothetical protein
MQLYRHRLRRQEECAMRTRPGFARLLPLPILAGLAAGTVALLVYARPVQALAPSVSIARPATLREGQVRVVTARECWMEDSRVPRYSGEVRERSVLCLVSTGRWMGTTSPEPPVRRISLEGADLYDLDLGATDLRNANIRAARLRGCNFSEARLTGADLRGAIFDRFTRWPAGFDPQAHGARLVR